MKKEEYQHHIAKKLIDDFKEKFTEKTDLEVTVVISGHKIPKIELNELEEIINQHLSNDRKLKKENIKIKNKEADLVKLRSIFYFIAVEIGYTYTSICKYMFRDHTTVIYGYKMFKQDIEFDADFQYLYNKIITNLIKKYGNGFKLLQFTKKEGVNSESTLSPVLL